MTELSPLQVRLFALVNKLREPNEPLADIAAAEVKLSDLGVSSLKMVNLMLSIELQFDIAIPQDEITPDNFHSVSSIESLLERLLPAAQR